MRKQTVKGYGYNPTNDIPVSKGGTGASTPLAALTSLGGLHTSQLNTANGYPTLDADGFVKPDNIPSGFNNSYNGPFIVGPSVITVNTQAKYVITDYNILNTYTAIVSHGAVTIDENTITVSAPSTPATLTLTVNNKTNSIDVVATNLVQKPIILSPGVEENIVGSTINVVASTFAAAGNNTLHLNSDWQIASDINFNTIVDSSLANSTNKTSYTFTTTLNNNTKYYIRVRYGSNGTNPLSDWSDPVEVIVSKNSIVVKPTIDANQFTHQNLTDGDVYIICSSFSLNSGVDSHQGSDWQLALDSNFNIIERQVINDGTNKTSILFNISSGTQYFVRVRHKGATNGYSEWSNAVTFTS